MDFNFISKEIFLEMDKEGEFLQVGTYQGNFYGTPKPPAKPEAPSGPSSRSEVIRVYRLIHQCYNTDCPHITTHVISIEHRSSGFFADLKRFKASSRAQVTGTAWLLLILVAMLSIEFD